MGGNLGANLGGFANIMGLFRPIFGRLLPLSLFRFRRRRLNFPKSPLRPDLPAILSAMFFSVEINPRVPPVSIPLKVLTSASSGSSRSIQKIDQLNNLNISLVKSRLSDVMSLT